MASSLRQYHVYANLTAQELAALSAIPALLPPPGVESNFDDPDSNNKAFFVVTSVLLFLSTLLVANRFYVKTYITRKYTLDDFVGLVAAAFTITLYIICAWGTVRGRTWVHRWDLSVAQAAAKDFMVPIWLFGASNLIAMGTVRITFLIAYLNIFGPMRWLRISAYTGVTFLTLFHGTTTVVVLILTTPALDKTWFSATTSIEYQYFLRLLVPVSSIGFVIDLCILILPLVAVSKLQMPPRKKMGICLIFLTGVAACIASALTIYYRYRLLNSLDVTWATMPVCLVTLVEMFVGLIVLCIPAAARSVRHHLESYQEKRKLSLRSKLLGPKHRNFQASDNADVQRRITIKKGPYSEVDGIEILTGLQAMYARGPRISISHGDQHGIEADSIHMTYELKSTSQEVLVKEGKF